MSTYPELPASFSAIPRFSVYLIFPPLPSPPSRPRMTGLAHNQQGDSRMELILGNRKVAQCSREGKRGRVEGKGRGVITSERRC